MANPNYKAQVVVVASDAEMIYRQAPISSFLVGGSAKVVDLNSASDADLISGLDLAKLRKNITLVKSPSDDDFDPTLLRFFQAKTKFGLNFDVYVNYTGKWIQIIHFFGQDATITNQPIRTGSAKAPSFKIEFGFREGDFKHTSNRDHKWAIDDEDWIK
jgi:hypothetical protein